MKVFFHSGVHLFDASSGKPLNDGKLWIHKIEIRIVALDQVRHMESVSLESGSLESESLESVSLE